MNQIRGMNTSLLTYKRGSYKTLWLGLLGAVVVVVASILFGYAQTQKKENAAMNPTKPVPKEADLRRQLTREQYRVTRECGTETPFHNAYWDNHQPGIYVDIITGEPLFTSLDKFDSGTGWPSFTKPISPDSVTQRQDSSHGMERTEVRSKSSDSHLTCIRRRTGADWTAVLREFRGAPFHPGRETQGRGIRPVSLSVPIPAGPEAADALAHRLHLV